MKITTDLSLQQTYRPLVHYKKPQHLMYLDNVYYMSYDKEKNKQYLIIDFNEFFFGLRFKSKDKESYQLDNN